MVNKINYPAELPIVRLKDDIIALLKEHPVLIVAGETGCGKTTQLPKMCLEAGLGDEGVIACTQPRRIAAITVARRVAEEMGAQGRELVGYKVRFLDRTSRRSRIKFLTDGMLLAEAARDRRLRRYRVIIIDEAHERSLNIDFLLGILKRLRKKRPDLKIIISSATMDTEKFSRHFEGAPVINIPGKTYPVEVNYLPPDESEEAAELTLSERVTRAVSALGRRPAGDILVFLPTERDIMETQEALKGEAQGLNAIVLPLFGRLPAKEQGRVFKNYKQLKIILASNVAETSVTVPGIRYVIDTGLARISSYNPRARTTKLPVVPISRASADQRKGRCGRVGPGICLRLYSEEDYRNRPEFTAPEVLRANLAEVIMRMVDLGLGHPQEFPFLEPPGARSIKDGFNLLDELGALKVGPGRQLRLTRRGRLMARLPLDPMISRMILEARERHVLHEVMVIAAVLSIQDPRQRPPGREKEADAAHAGFLVPGSDFLTCLNIWSNYHHTARAAGSQSKLRKYCRQKFLSYLRMREWCDIYAQICQALDEEGHYNITVGEVRADAVHQAVLSGILRNIALKKAKNIYQGAQGKELMIFPGSGQFGRGGQWIMAAELVETSRLYARTVAAINPRWLESMAGGLCRYSYSNPHWAKSAGAVLAQEKVTLFGLVIEAGRPKNFGVVEPEAARGIFIQAALVEGQVKGNYDFLRHNQELVASLKDMEDRVRQRRLVDDYLLYTFYDERLPALVWDLAGLRRVLPDMGRLLYMKREDIIQREADEGQLALFPKTMRAGDFELDLFYKFTPGSEADGVSVHIPAAILPHLRPELFDWLVAGMLPEKIVQVLRGLPKGLRKQLVPVNETADKVLAGLEFGRGSFYAALAAVIERQLNLAVGADVLAAVRLPDHLLMRYCLLAEGGKVVKASRRFVDLLTFQGGKKPTTSFKDLRQKWERQTISPLELAGLPEKIAVRDNKGRLAGYAIPALNTAGGDKVGIRLCLSSEEARQYNRQGLLELYKSALSKQVREAAGRFKLSQADWPLFQGLGAMKEVNTALLDAVLRAALPIEDGELAGHDFAAEVERLRAGEFFQAAGKFFALVEEALRQRRQTLDTVNKFEGRAAADPLSKRRFKEYRRQLNLILPPDFLITLTTSGLRHVPRYLKALRIRVERAHAAPAQDLKKEEIVAPCDERLAEAVRRAAAIEVPASRRAVEEVLEKYRLMIAEYRVSIFAQELKTVIPVSAKRLRRQEDELFEMLGPG
ncbi:ATP-dependent RNA helicase HrpA [Desulfobacterota bacterium M19]